jgi:hypothetical protein
VAWGAAVLVASLGGGLWFAYVYVTDSETLARVIRAEAPRYLPGSRVDLGRVRVRLFTGEVQVTHLMVRQAVDGAAFPTVRVPWLSVRHNARAVLGGRFEPSEVVVAQPTLRLCRRKDGSWNLQGLLASPWPGPVMKTPPVQILNGTVELCEGASGAPATAILRDVAVRVESAGKGRLSFEGTAKGDTFDRLTVQGTVEIATGRVELQGDLARLAISDPLRGRLPAELKPAVGRLGLTGGEADLRISRVRCDPSAEPRLSYEVSGRLRAGAWNCPKLPFPLNDLSAGFAARDGVLTLDRAEGYYGTTTVRVERGTFRLGDPERAPFDLKLEIVDLKLDQRLRDWSPPGLDDLWEGFWKGFRPSGRLSVALHASRAVAGGPVRHEAVVDCLDVAMLYEHFKYPLDHVRGRLVWEGDRIKVMGLQTLVGGQPLSARGTIDHPGPGAVAALEFAGKAVPIDEALLAAMSPEVREVVEQFKPTGTVGGTATVRRRPPSRPGDDPRGEVAFDASLDLNERCGITWAGLPYPVNNLTGRLEIHPDLWEFKEMRGGNGQAVITGSGRVEKVGGTAQKPALKVDLNLNAEKLPLDDQLRAALPRAWQRTWAVLEPTGSADVAAVIKVEPGRDDDYHLEIRPRPATGVRLRYSRPPKPGSDPGGHFELPMDHVTGLFVFNNGPVDMRDVGFHFYGAPVQFARGRVIVEDSGKFQLGVEGLWVKDIRLESRLRTIMPPVMAQFAQRLDDGRTFTLKGDLGLGWSGQPGVPVWCRWKDALVVFNDNSAQIQPGLSLEHIQGQFDHVHGWTDGEAFDVHGALNLASVSLLGQQITRLESPVDVSQGVARLENIRGDLLGGELTGRFRVSLDATPKYAAALAVRGADLRQYAKTLQGRQSFRGRVEARLELNGFGGDPRTLQGGGEAHVADGDLGELPVFLRLVKILNLSAATKTAFDSADVALSVRDGTTYLDPIRFTGDAFSLHGRGTMDVQGDLDLGLRVLYGRDRVHLRLLSDAMREASGQFLVVRVLGTPSFPKFRLVPLPEASEFFKSLGQRRGEEKRR